MNNISKALLDTESGSLLLYYSYYQAAINNNEVYVLNKE